MSCFVTNLAELLFSCLLTCIFQVRGVINPSGGVAYLQVSLDVGGDLQHVLRPDGLDLLLQEGQGEDGGLRGHRRGSESGCRVCERPGGTRPGGTPPRWEVLPLL